MFLLGGVADARIARRHKVAGTPTQTTRETCVVRALPSAFMDQGEFYASSSVADVVEVSCEPVYAGHYVRVAAAQLYNRCDKRLLWFAP